MLPPPESGPYCRSDVGSFHPCTYFSRKLTPVESNYDIGNREMLTIKLNLEEWHHWLEVAHHHFTVITDNKHFQYLREAKRLNPRQAWWALFFTCFQFTIMYCPRNRNCKANALSLLNSPYTPTEPESILWTESNPNAYLLMSSGTTAFWKRWIQIGGHNSSHVCGRPSSVSWK